MAIIATNAGGDFERENPEPGTFAAKCWNVFDLGMQENFTPGAPPQRKILIFWELDQRYKTGDFAGKRFLVHKKYTLSTNEKANLRKDLKSWKGSDLTEAEIKEFDVEQVIGGDCLLNIQIEEGKNGKKYPEVVAILPPMKGGVKMVLETSPDYKPEWVAKLQADALPELGPMKQVPDNQGIF